MKNSLAQKFRNILERMSLLEKSVPFVGFLGIALVAFNSLCSDALGNPSQTKPTDPISRAKSWDYHVKLREESLFAKMKWRTVGPAYQGGRIESIACPDGYTSTIYIGVGSGNLWKSVNNGTTWKPIFDNESTFTIGSVAVSKSNPDVVWVGTGEVLMARSSFAGTGVFKSVDASQTWQNMGLDDTHHIARVLIDPVDPDVVYVAAIGHNYSFNEQRGLFKTTDGGKTWEKILYISDKVACVEVVMDPVDNRILYAVMWERDRKAWNNVAAGPGSGLYKSTDAGSTWKQLKKGLPRGKNVGRIGIAVAQSNPNVVYALVDNHNIRPDGKKSIAGEVYRSNNKGKSFKKVNKDDLQTSINYAFCLIRVSPDDENQIYLLGTYLLQSNDGGKTYARNQGKIINLLPHDAKVIHLDHHDLWIDPLNPDRLIDGTDGGLYTSYDRGKTWLRLNNIPVAEVYALTVDMAEPYNVYIGTQDDAALFGPAAYTLTDGVRSPWKHVYLDQWGGGDSYFTYVDPTDPETIYYEHQFGSMRRKNMKDGSTKSVAPKSPKGGPALRRNWMTPFIISHHNPLTLYYGADKLFKSINRADDWTCISGDLTTSPGPEKQGNVPYGTITTISESLLKAGLIYIGTDDGKVQVTKDDGRNWTDITADLPDKWVSRVTASRHDLDTAYVSLTGYRNDDFEKYLYMSQDSGKTWKSIVANLPAESINVIAEDPRDKDILYVGTDLGVYATIDGAKTWHSLCGNLPTTPVHDLLVHPRQYELVIGTHGRGVFVLDVKNIKKP